MNYKQNEKIMQVTEKTQVIINTNIVATTQTWFYAQIPHVNMKLSEKNMKT